MFEILWPERRVVSRDKIRIWYSDAVANGEVEQTRLTNIDQMARELHSAGLITLSRGSIPSIPYSE